MYFAIVRLAELLGRPAPKTVLTEFVSAVGERDVAEGLVLKSLCSGTPEIGFAVVAVDRRVGRVLAASRAPRSRVTTLNVEPGG